jgi:tRNA U34 5-methylaminomethyl-2-thiouridine-forming methyltransferase MnmC
MNSPQFEIVTTRMGELSIRDNVTQEIMHNPVGPWAEANALYIDQSHMRRRLSEDLLTELVIFDVGLGAAANALAALHCARGAKNRRSLRLVSFEQNLELLKFALQNSHHFHHFNGFEEAVKAILESGRWEEDGLIWELRYGNFLERIETETTSAHLVFYDPYSSKKNREMWVPEAFRKVREKCRPDGVLLTYSRATPVRVGMLLAGFYVGVGTASGAKDETTQACVRYEDLAQPLGPAWLDRWRRSHNPNALGASEEEFPATQQFILTHSQFTK